ncbi:MAG: TIGR04283 family arsenosugar biosynthesis glycosyltransferase [Nitrospinota bacterium]
MSSVSIIIPVWREGDRVAKLLKFFSKCFSGELVVVLTEGDKETELPLHSGMVIIISKRRGRAFQMNEGAKFATGDILLFLHADTIIPTHTIPTLGKKLKIYDAVAGAYKLEIDAAGWIYRLIEFGVDIRSRFFGLPYGDQAIFIKRILFENIGGYNELALMEDVDLIRRIHRVGRIIYEKGGTARTSSRRWEKNGPIKTTIKNWILISAFYFGFDTKKLAKFYYDCRSGVNNKVRDSR